MSKIIVITGPTASGKSSLALSLAKEFNSEIVSADSMQIYRYMDIGTAKPTSEERQLIKHHIIDIIDPDYEGFSVASYQKKAAIAINSIIKSNKKPIIVGGTGLYIKSLISGVDYSDFKSDDIFRNELMEFSLTHGNQALHHKLAMVDPSTASKLHPNDSRRVIRALEVHHYTGKKISEYQNISKQKPPLYNAIVFAIRYARDELYERIERRVDVMMDMGLVEEVRNLLKMGYSENLASMKSIGYLQLNKYLKSECTFEESVLSIKQETRRYAKRQMTWFNRDQRINWIDGHDLLDDSIKKIKKIIDEESTTK